jgi:peptide/nickel transport system ATP-binding protein
LLFQDPAAMLNPGMTVRQHLEESATVHAVPDPPASAEEMAGRVGLLHRIDAYPGELSGGEKRRVGLARVLVPIPALLVADEPTAGLDAALKADLIDAIVAHRSDKSAVLLISHDLPMMAYACDRIVVMLEGKVVDRFASSDLGKIDHHPYTLSLLRAAGILPQAEAVECARGEE